MKKWKLSQTDLLEIARNSVLISSFPDKYKDEWIGDKWKSLRFENGDLSDIWFEEADQITEKSFYYQHFLS